MITARQAADKALSQVGYKEGRNNSNKFGAAYGMNNCSWCCIFIWWIFHVLNAAVLFFGGGKTASCTALWKWAKNAGLAVSKYSLKIGDIVFFDWDRTGGDDCDHVGIVVGVNGSQITTVEGNTSAGTSGSQSNGDGVYRRYRSVSQIAHAYRPKYEKSSSEEWCSVNIPLIKRGAKGKAVFMWQSFLKQKGYAVGEVDSDFGSKTESATKAWQKANGLTADGEVGAKSWSKAFGV